MINSKEIRILKKLIEYYLFQWTNLHYHWYESLEDIDKNSTVLTFILHSCYVINYGYKNWWHNLKMGRFTVSHQI